jgi:hypothetical protein
MKSTDLQLSWTDLLSSTVAFSSKVVKAGPSTGESVCLDRFGGVGALPAARAAAEGLGSSGMLAGSGGLGGTAAVSFMAKAAASAALRASSAAEAAARAEAASALAASSDSCTAACVYFHQSQFNSISFFEIRNHLS